MRIVDAIVKAKQRADMAVENQVFPGMFKEAFCSGYVAFFRGMSREEIEEEIGLDPSSKFAAYRSGAAKLGYDIAIEDAETIQRLEALVRKQMGVE